MKKGLLLFLSFLLLSCNKNKIEDKDYFIVYDQADLSPDQKEKLLDSLTAYILSHHNDSTARNSLFEVASYYENLGLDAKYYTTVNEVYSRALEDKDTLHIAQALWYKGDYYNSREQNDSAFLNYSQAEKLYRLSQKDSLNWGRMLLYKAGALYRIGIYTESEVETVKALKVFSALNPPHPRLLYESLVQMALNLEELHEYNDALKYYYKALEQLDELQKGKYPSEKLFSSLISCYNNIGNLLDRMGDYDKAKEYYLKALSEDNLQNSPKLHAMLLNNYANHKLLAGEEKGVDSLLTLSLKIRDSIGHEQGIIASKVRIGEYKLKLKDTLPALQLVNEAYALAIKHQSHLDILRCLEFLSKNDIKNKNYYTDRYIAVADSLADIDRMTKNKFARISYETEQVTLRNQELIKKNTLLFFLFIGAITTIAITVVAYRYKLKNRELKHKQREFLLSDRIYEMLQKEKMIENEIRAKERNRISQELHDGIVNQIFSARLNLEWLETDNQELKSKLIEGLKKTEEQVRNVSHDIHNSIFAANQDFKKMLEELVLNQKNEHKTQFDITVDPLIDWSIFSDRQKVHIYRIIQESLNNVNKYAKASKCFVLLLRMNNQLILRIHDDGVGFNVQKAKSGLGFKTLQERSQEINGKLTIKSEAGKGTTIEVIIG